MNHTDDEKWMRLALDLARRGRGFVEPNPMVGAVVVQEGEIVGNGWHEKFGSAHAEINALSQAGERARNATLYVTLEPCCHAGKTPPCVNAVILSGIQRVVVAITDPFPPVAGRGIARLAAAGLAVEVGCCEKEVRELNRPYLTLMEKGRPYVHLKWAMSLDGKIATRTGDSKWISNEASRAIVHKLRGQMDAIIVGANTVRVDNPLLTARPAGPRTPTRIVVTANPELPAGCRLLQTVDQAPVIVAAKVPGSIPGAEVVATPNIAELLNELGRRRMTNVMVEGGAGLLGSFIDACLVDEVHIFMSAMLIGGVKALSPSGGSGVLRIAEALRLNSLDMRMIAGDIYLRGIV